MSEPYIAGYEYTKECEAEQRELEARWLVEDIQEALSIRYVDALRVVLLSSGHWAVFPLASAIHPEIMESLSEEKMKEMLSAQALRDARIREEVEKRLAEPAAAPGKSVSLEELGLL